MLKKMFLKDGRRLFAVFVFLVAPLMMLWAQEMNEKYSMTTQMFFHELNEKKEPSVVNSQLVSKLIPSDEMIKLERESRLIASPDTVGGVVYISCFIHLKNATDLSEVRSLGVKIEETFDGLDFVTASVPVNQIKSLAGIDNVTRINVAQQMRLTTDVAKQKTKVDDVLTQSPDAIAQGILNKYDGTGVVLGIIDTGIDFQHIAFKDKNGNSRIKRAYIQTSSDGIEYTESTIGSATTDDETADHGTHTASTAGGSSVIVNGSDVSVTDDHANATYGGMAPGADLYLAGVVLSDTYITNALNKMVQYSDAQGKPLVVSNSWGSQIGAHDGTGEIANVVNQYFGNKHPNRIILFASSNDAGNSKDNEGGGIFVKKSSASSSSPLGTILRSACFSNTDGGFYYNGYISTAWSSSPLNCKLYVIENSTGAVKTSWTLTSSTSSFSGLSDYYNGTLYVYTGSEYGKNYLNVRCSGLSAKDYTTSYKDGEIYYNSPYSLAIEVYPASGSANVDMWANSKYYFSNHLTTSGHAWTAGTDDMSVSTQTTISNAISVGAYVSKTSVKNYEGTNSSYSSGTLDDIADFSSYATAEQSPTGQAYPWITAPGAQVVAGVNHYHTASVDEGSFFYDDNKERLVVNNTDSPYGVMQGTSMSTPVAAGIVALWLQAAQSVNMDLTVNDVKKIMEQTAIHDSYTTTGANASHFGKGKIDALAGIQYILQSDPSEFGGDPYDDGDTFTANTEEGVEMTFKVISAADKTCQVGVGESTDVVTIGESTSNSTNMAPYDNYYKYSTVQMLYTPDEVGQKGKITKIAYKVASSTSCPTTSVKIYMGHKSGIFSSTSDYVTSSNLTLVYSGSPTLGSSTGWETLTLNQNSFTYNGTDNLVVVITKSCSDYISALKYSCFTGSGYMLYRNSDSDTSYGNITNTSTSYSTATTRPSVKFTIETLPVAIPTTTRGIITIPSTVNNYKVVSIGEKAFNNCTSVSGVKIPGTITDLQTNAFYGCTGLIGITSKIRFPFAVVSSVFNSIPTNATLYVPYGSKERYESTNGWNGFESIVEMEPEDGDVFTAMTDEDVDMTFKITSVSEMTCHVTTGNESVSSFVPTIPSGTPDLITVPEEANGFTITGIDSHAFSGCNALTSVSIPGNVSSIGDAVFEGCDNLVSVYFDVVTPVAISESVFPNRANATLYVPASSKSSYETADYWKEFKIIKEMPDKVNNAIDLADAIGCRGGLVVQPIILKNNESIVGFQFDLLVSEGVTVAQDADGKYMATLTERKADHLLSVNKVGERLYRFVSISMNNTEFNGTDGAILNVKLKIDESVVAGTYEVKVQNTELINVVKDNIYSVKNMAALTVQDAEPGDVNGDFSVSVTDVTGIIGYILNDPPAIFIEYAAHMNDDKKISVTDAVIVIDKILHDGVDTQNRAQKQMGPEPQ